MAGKQVPKEEPKVLFRVCAFFKETFAKHPEIKEKFDEFRRFKEANPLARFGGKDQHFTGDGDLKDAGIIHAHLSGDVSILYLRHGKNPTLIDLCAVVSHDELGTGRPSSPKQQRKVAKIITGQTFEGKRK